MDEEKKTVQHKRDVHGNVVTKQTTTTNKPSLKKQRLAVMASAFAVLFVAAAVLLGFSVSRSAQLANNLENQYQRNMYDLMANVSNLEVKLDKVLVSNDPAMQSTLLTEIYMISQQTSDHLAALPLEHEYISDATAYVNRLGAYAYSLRNGQLTSVNLESLSQLHDNALDIQSKLNETSSRMYGRYRIVDSINLRNRRKAREEQVNFDAGFQQMNKNNIDYPELLYDGPFSESLVKNVSTADEEKITADYATKILNDSSSVLGIKNIRYHSDIKERVQKYGFTADADNNSSAFITVLKDNGFIDSMTVTRGVAPMKAMSGRALRKQERHIETTIQLSDEQAIEKAEKFMADLGISNMKAVWLMNHDDIAYVNLAPVIDDIVIYPELIKVKVARDNGQIMGLEGMSYAYNHKSRNLAKQDIMTNISINKDLIVKSKRLCIAPKDHIGEVLAYEVEAMRDDDRYFIYVDAKTGKEIEIMKVITANEGMLLL